jgi:hypothetical protein
LLQVTYIMLGCCFTLCGLMTSLLKGSLPCFRKSLWSIHSDSKGKKYNQELEKETYICWTLTWYQDLPHASNHLILTATLGGGFYFFPFHRLKKLRNREKKINSLGPINDRAGLQSQACDLLYTFFGTDSFTFDFPTDPTPW